MSNQFVNPMLLEDYASLLLRPEVAAMVADLEQRTLADPDACLTLQIGNYKPSMFQLRIDAKKTWVSARALLWVKLHGTLPIFGTCSCKTPGCVSPAHQVVLAAERLVPATPRAMNYGVTTTQAAQVAE